MLWNFNYIQKIDYDTKQEHQKSEIGKHLKIN